MQKILTAIGAITVICAIAYFAVIRPFNAYQDMEEENIHLKKDLQKSKDDVAQVYARFDEALHTHLDDSTVQAIYDDPVYFTKGDSQISINTDSGEIPLISYNCR